MRVPLEILRAILEYVRATSNRVELLQLRLVSSIFDVEILALVFADSDQLPHIPSDFYEDSLSHRYWRWVNYTDRNRRGAIDFRFINSDKWMTVPPTLQRKYVLFRLVRDGDQQSLFTGLFTGVRDLVASSDNDFKEQGSDLTELLLSLCAFDKKTSWVVAHHAPNLFKVFAHLHRLNLARKRSHTPSPLPPLSPSPSLQSGEEDGEDPSLDPHFLSWTSEIHLGYSYALACRCILQNDVPLLLKTLSSNPTIDMTSTTLCFGTSILGFAIQKGSPTLLRDLLAARPLVKQQSRAGACIASRRDSGALERHSVYELLCMATWRTTSPCDVEEILTILFAHLQAAALLTRSSRPEKLLAKAIWGDVPALVDFLVERVDGEKYGRELKRRVEEVMSVGGFRDPRQYRSGAPFGVRLRTGWPKWSVGMCVGRRRGMGRSLGVLCERFPEGG